MTTTPNEPTASEAADLAHGAAKENMSGRQDQRGSPQVKDTGREKPQTEEEKLKAQGLADDDDVVDDKKEKLDAGDPVDKVDDADGKDWTGEYITFGDAAADSVVDLLKEAGVGAREANLIFQEAVEADDLSKVKWDVLEERLGAAKARLAKMAITDYHDREYKKNVATTKAAHELVGGEKNWQKVAKWAKTKQESDPAFMGVMHEIRTGINAGGKLAAFAVAELKAAYEADPRNSGLGVAKVQRGTSAPKSNPHGEPLSRKDYLAEIKKANEGRPNPQLIAQLQARRQAGRAAGI